MAQCVKRQYRKGERVWQQGDPADSIAFLVQGKALSVYSGGKGRYGATGIWSWGDIIGGGVIGSVENQRQVTLKCLEDTTVYYLELTKFYSILKRFPEVALVVINALSVRLRWANQLTQILQTRTAFSRVCNVLLYLADRFPLGSPAGLVIDVVLTHGDLAAMIGISRQFMTVTLHDLEKRRLVSVKSRRITLLNVPELERLSSMA
jgi:CRP-like cAMP-binding protein